MKILIGAAGWCLPRAEQQHFASAGSHLELYAARFPIVEMNSSFRRSHRAATCCPCRIRCRRTFVLLRCRSPGTWRLGEDAEDDHAHAKAARGGMNSPHTKQGHRSAPAMCPASVVRYDFFASFLALLLPFSSLTCWAMRMYLPPTFVRGPRTCTFVPFFRSIFPT